jgi:hypothetical protein
MNKNCSMRLTPPPFHQQLQLQRFCSRELDSVRMRALDPATFEPLGNAGWELREDVPGKPGWVYETENLTVSGRGTIWFKVHFSLLPQLEVTFLRTYENIGQAFMFIGPETMTGASLHQAFRNFTLDGNHQTKVSVPFMQVFKHPNNNHHNHGDGVLLPVEVGSGNFVVAFQPISTTEHYKFKLISLSSC